MWGNDDHFATDQDDSLIAEMMAWRDAISTELQLDDDESDGWGLIVILSGE